VNSGATNITFPLPASLPSGDYLVRIEHIGLHVAKSAGGAQFYISCGQLTVTGGGSGSPAPLVAFPGAYDAKDPGILIDIYSPVVSSSLED
jgi:Auxiliary Activity family 9 (formerly GH61)